MTQELSHHLAGAISCLCGLAMISVALMIFNNTEEYDGFCFLAAFLSFFGFILTLDGFITLF